MSGSILFLHFVGNKAKGRISKRVFQENKARQVFREKQTYLTFGVLFFLETPVLRFGLLLYYRRFLPNFSDYFAMPEKVFEELLLAFYLV